MTAKPFLKWVGGKTQLLTQYAPLFPKRYKRYFEPFFGGGAVYFYFNPSTASINDINQNLIAAYLALRDKTDEVIDGLRLLQTEYHTMTDEEQRTFYYEQRQVFNQLPPTDVAKTILLIFLNKTCFNGLYRENKKGQFNVPFGRYKNPLICNEPQLRQAAQLLAHTEITSTPFEQAVEAAQKGDFVYLDPPYHPLNATSNFTGYSENDFTVQDQIRLKELVDDLTKRGCQVMLSNSNTPFIRDLYKAYRQEVVLASRAVNSRAAKRGKIKEIVIMNY